MLPSGVYLKQTRHYLNRKAEWMQHQVSDMFWLQDFKKKKSKMGFHNKHNPKRTSKTVAKCFEVNILKWL